MFACVGSSLAPHQTHYQVSLDIKPKQCMLVEQQAKPEGANATMGKGSRVYMCDITPGKGGVIYATLRYEHSAQPALIATLFHCLDRLATGEYVLVAPPMPTVAIKETEVDGPGHLNIRA